MWKWAKSVNHVYRKQKEKLLPLNYVWDIKVESTSLNLMECVAKREDGESLAKPMSEEEINWA